MDESLELTISELRAARQRRGLSQAQVAERIGTTQSAVARLETAQSDPRISTVQRYAEAVGMSVSVQRIGSPSLDRTGRDVRDALARHDPGEALRHVIQLLDDVQRMDAESRAGAVRGEPDPVGDRRWDALLAGTAEYACRLFNLAVPGWTAAPGRFLHRFWFVIEDIIGRPAPGLAAMAFVSSPPPLANRGVFLDRASLVSV